MIPGFGVFGAFWDGRPRHLSLMNLVEIEDSTALEDNLNFLYSIIESNSEEIVHEGVSLLCTNADWRPNLVGCITLLALKPEKSILHAEELWQRMIRHTWVSPQVVVTLSRIDPGFSNRAEGILKDGILMLPDPSVPWDKEKDPHSEIFIKDRESSKLKMLAAMHAALKLPYASQRFDDSGNTIALRWQSRLESLTSRGKVKIGVY